MKTQLNSRLARRWAQTFTKHDAMAYARGLAPALMTLTFAAAAHAQGTGAPAGTIDFSGATKAFTSIQIFVIAVGATFLIMAGIFAAVRFAGGRMAEAAMGFVGVLIGALIIGFGPGWINSLSGQGQTAGQ